MENNDQKFISLLQQQLQFRKEGIHNRIEKRQNELKGLEEEMKILVDDYNALNIFQNTRKKAIQAKIKDCENEIGKLLENNKKDADELKKLNEI